MSVLAVIVGACRQPVMQWWARRQFSRGRAVPYEVGTYRAGWAAYPELIRQYHPELNHGIALSQVPLAADVLLCWECPVGHRFAATPTEQARATGPGAAPLRVCVPNAPPSPVRNRSCSARHAPSPRKPRRPAPALCTKTPICPPEPRS